MKRIMLFIGLFFFFIVNVNAIDLNSKYAVLHNIDDGQIVFSKNKDEVISVASLTKIMTTLVAIENIKDYNEKVILNHTMFEGLSEANAYVIGLRSGQTVTYNDLLYGMFLASGADATRAIAISVASSEENFVNLMNEKVKLLNLKNTHFSNTVGLDDEKHFSTVNDIATILNFAFKNEKFREIFLTDKYSLSDGSITVYSSIKRGFNNFNVTYENILGGKTGYTGNAGRCLASIAFDSKNNINYLLVLANAENIQDPIYDTRNIYDYYFENYKYHNLIKKGDLILKIPTKYSRLKQVEFYAKKDVKKYLKNDFKMDDVSIKYKGINLVTPNMKENKKLGIINIYYKNKLVDSIDVRLNIKIKFSLLEFILEEKFIVISFFIFIFISILLFILRKKKFFYKKY